MIVQCWKCGMYFDDQYRWTICPHEAFLSNDGRNNFSVHEESYLNGEPPTVGMSKLADQIEGKFSGYWVDSEESDEIEELLLQGGVLGGEGEDEDENENEDDYKHEDIPHQEVI